MATGAEGEGLWRSVRSMPPAAWILFGGSFVNRFGSFVLVFLVIWLTEQGYSPAQAGAAVSCYGAGGLASSLLGGYLADRICRRNAIAVSMFSAAATMLALSQARTLPAVLVLSALAGLTSELYRPASAALLADLVPPERRLTAYALYRLAINAGFAAGPATAGLLAERSFFLVFLGEAITSAAFGVAALVLLPEGVRAPRAEERPGELLRAVRADRPFQLFLAASFLGAFVYFQQQGALPLHVVDQGLSYAAFGLLISLNGLVVVLLELPLTALTGRYPRRPVIALGFLVEGAGFALTAWATNMPLLALTVVIWTVGEIVSAPVAQAYVADLAPAHLRGRYQGAWGLMFGLALVLAPVIGTAAYGASPTALWLACGGLGALAALLTLGGRPRRRRRRALPVAPSPAPPG
ncbi:MAG TPA: MFS transporter [Gaiellaceae bacterium]|nr:MFS transporter [Gaiellaceae bacterium]